MRPSFPILMGLFAAYSYGATVASAAWFLRRDHGLDVMGSLIWAALLFSPWVAVGPMVWAVLGLIRRPVHANVVLASLALPFVPTAAFATTMIDGAMRGANWTGADVLGRAVDRLPVAILLYTAIAAAALAAAYWLRADRHRHEMRALAAALADLRAPMPEGSPTLFVSVGRRRVPVSPGEIEWVSSAGNYAVVHWGDQEGLLRETLQTLEARLEPARFARGHRSTLINLARVADLSPLADGTWRATMESGAELVISRTYRDAVLARLGRIGLTPPPATSARAGPAT